MMNKKKVLTSLVLGTAMVSQVAVPVFAAKQTNETPNTNPDAHTTIGILESDETDLTKLNVSFEVPLYVTTAALSGKTALTTPKTYDIKNTGENTIVVTGMNFEKISADDQWVTVDQGQVTGDKAEKKVALKIGDVNMPAVSKQGEKVPVNIKTAASNAFYSATKYNAITKDSTLAKSPTNEGSLGVETNKTGLKIEGTIAAATREKTNPNTNVPQFKVTYLISAVKAGTDNKQITDDKLIGYTYVGDDKSQALMQ